MARQIWATDDGKTFDTQEQAEAWEQRLATRNQLVRVLEASKRPGPRLPSDSADFTPPSMEEIADFLLDQVPGVVDVILACGAEPQAK